MLDYNLIVDAVVGGGVISPFLRIEAWRKIAVSHESVNSPWPDKKSFIKKGLPKRVWRKESSAEQHRIK